LPNEDQKLDSLRPGSGEMERGCREGQNFQVGSSAPGRRRHIVQKHAMFLQDTHYDTHTDLTLSLITHNASTGRVTV